MRKPAGPLLSHSKTGWPRPGPRPAPSPHDAELIERAQNAGNGALFSRLWAGDTSSCASASEADLALCSLLTFWTGADAAWIGRLFRQSGLMREKWDEKRGTETYGERTSATAIAGCRETYSGPRRPTVEVSDDVAQEPEPPAAPQPYTFSPAVPEDHFFARYIKYAAGRTDAAHEYHEAASLILLAGGTPTIRAQLAPYPNGLAGRADQPETEDVTSD